MSPRIKPEKGNSKSRLNGYHDWEGMKKTASKYIFAAKLVSTKVCLDIACGSGYGSSYLMKSGAQAVVRGDISETTIQYARAHYVQDGLRFALMDAHELPFRDESFDAVVSIETIEHLKTPEQVLSECHRVLKSGEWFMISTPNKAMASPYTRKPLEPLHIKEFSIDELCFSVEKRFREVAIYGQFYNKDSVWRLNVLAVQFISPLIRSLPKGQSILYFLNRFVLRRQHVKLDDLSEMMSKGLVEDDVLPFPQESKELGCIILTAQK